MKNIINSIITLTIIAFTFSACDPHEDSAKDLGSIVNKNDIKIDVTTVPSKTNDFQFTLTTPECVGMFSCPELGIGYTGISFAKYVPWAGTYNMTVQVYNKAGISESVSIPFTVEATDPAICQNDLFKKLTGGCDMPQGKTWRIDGSKSGHIGCGPENANSNEWWNPGPYSLPGALYDDDLTFVLNAQQKCILSNKGASYMNESTASMFPDGDPAGSFVTTHYTPSPNASWSIETQNQTNWLVLTGAVPAYGVNPASLTSGKYKIVSITDTDMHIVFLPGGISWHYYLTSTPR